MCIIGNSIDFSCTESTDLNKVAEQGTASVDRHVYQHCVSGRLGMELKATSSKIL